MKEFHSKLNHAKSNLKRRDCVGITILISLAIFIPLTINIVSLKYLFFSGPDEWLNVHLILHSHDDVGWLKTPEVYYDEYVREILKNTIFELQKNNLRKFVYVETYFLWKWWREQTEETREIVKDLIERKQLEIIGGGFCVSDEAVTYYQSFIDQSTWGFRFLNDTFGPNVCPTVAWQIDTFGHSKGIASLLGQMGFNSLFFSRLDVKDYNHRKHKKFMEFLWWGNENLGDSGSIFTSILYQMYCSPKGFDFETQQENATIDFSGFSNYARRQSNSFMTNNVLVPMGNDFGFVKAKKVFDKLDELIRFFKNNPKFKLNVFYSTPSEYIQRLREADLIWPEKHGDFFPYAAEVGAFWTGYFTSRPTLKYFERVSNNFLQICKQLLVFAHKGGMQYFDELTTLREAVGVLQHHDAVTGTAQQHVTDHYAKLLHEGITDCARPVDLALGNLSVVREDFKRPIYRSCLLLNISSCFPTENHSRFVVTVYNSLSRKVDHYVRIPVTSENYAVLTGDGTKLINQIVAIPDSVRNIPGRTSPARSELIFKAANVPAMGFKSYYVTTELSETRSVEKREKVSSDWNLKAVFDLQSRLLSGFKTKNGNISIVQNFKYYESIAKWSGAYLFRPKKKSQQVGEEVFTKLLNEGELVEEHEQVFSDWASQIVRVYRGEDYAEFEWLIGPIPVDGSAGIEVVSVYESEINSGEIYYTDVNGMQMEKRRRNYKDWVGKTSETISGNFYPVTTMISIRDEKNQLSLIVDRPEGGCSLRSGEFQLMVHRRLFSDDGRGVLEPLNESAYGVGLVVRGRHWLLPGRNGLEANQRAKLFSQTRHSEPWLFFFDATSLSFEEWRSNYITEFSGLYNYVPRNVRVLTLEPWREDTILLRLEHVFERVPSSSLLNEPVTINLKNLFKGIEIVEARETALGADRWLSDVKRIKWKSRGKIFHKEQSRKNRFGEFEISLKPQQIRTFIVKIKPKFNQ